jgi:hypothetical protein
LIILEFILDPHHSKRSHHFACPRGSPAQPAQISCPDSSAPIANLRRARFSDAQNEDFPKEILACLHIRKPAVAVLTFLGTG